jgi:RNA polymerase sigma-70 factor (ECF subfamily)
MRAEGEQIGEKEIRRAWDAGDFGLTATLALRKHGTEIMSFLVWRLRSPNDGSEAFSMFAEDLWSGLRNFEWRCSLRTWLYVLARNAAQRYGSSAHKRLERRHAITGEGEIAALIARITTQSFAYQRTDVKTRVRELRERLSPEDQMLLVLRIDRGLAWRDLAVSMSGDLKMDEQRLDREAARLRKCFERIKGDLRRWAQEEGVLNASS